MSTLFYLLVPLVLIKLFASYLVYLLDHPLSLIMFLMVLLMISDSDNDTHCSDELRDYYAWVFVAQYFLFSSHSSPTLFSMGFKPP